jgi:hypothetical protein
MVASCGRRSACSSCLDRDAPPAAHTWAERRGPSVGAGWGGLSCRAGGKARADRDAPPAAHTWAARRAPRQCRLGRAVASRGRHSACSSCLDRDAPPAAHTWAASRARSVSAGWAGRSHRAGGTARARPAAIATRRQRITHGPHGARPPPAPAGEGGRVMRAAQRVLVPLRSRRAGSCTRRSAHFRQRRLGRAVACAARRAPSVSATSVTLSCIECSADKILRVLTHAVWNRSCVANWYDRQLS